MDMTELNRMEMGVPVPHKNIITPKWYLPRPKSFNNSQSSSAFCQTISVFSISCSSSPSPPTHTFLEAYPSYMSLPFLHPSSQIKNCKHSALKMHTFVVFPSSYLKRDSTFPPLTPKMGELSWLPALVLFFFCWYTPLLILSLPSFHSDPHTHIY